MFIGSPIIIIYYYMGVLCKLYGDKIKTAIKLLAAFRFTADTGIHPPPPPPHTHTPFRDRRRYLQ